MYFVKDETLDVLPKYLLPNIIVMKQNSILIFVSYCVLIFMVSCVSKDEKLKIQKEQQLQIILGQDYPIGYWERGDSMLCDLREMGILSDKSYSIIQEYVHWNIFEKKLIDLVNLGDSISKILDTIPSMNRKSPFAFDIKEDATWRDFKEVFTKKGYYLSPILDTHSPQFIKNPKFTGSGCPLMFNPDYHRIIPYSIIETKPEKYKKVDTETGFVYLYRNSYTQNLYGKAGNGKVAINFWGDSLLSLGYYFSNTPNLHDIFVEKYGVPVYDKTEWSNLNGSDSINIMIWEYKNMRIRYTGFLRYKSYYKSTDMPHSVGVYSEHKERNASWKEYEPILKARQKEDSEKWLKEELDKQRQKEEKLKQMQLKAFKDAI